MTGKSPAETYKDLLQVSNSNSGVDATLRDVEDGEGTVSALQVSTTDVNVNGTFTVNGSPLAGGVASVNGQTGVVVLDADDISDTATANKYTTAAEITKLSGVEALADVTDATNVASAGGLIGTNNLSDVTTASTALANIGGIGSATTDTLTNKTFDANGTGNSLSNVSWTGDGETGTDGEIPTFDASGNPAFVATGTATHVLTSNGAGTAPTFQASAGGGGGGGAWVTESVTDITSTINEIDITLNTGADFHKFIYFFETQGSGSQLAFTCNNDTGSGKYQYQSNGAYNGAAVVGEDTSEFACKLTDQSTLSKNVSGEVNIRGVANIGSTTHKIIDARTMNVVTSTAYENMNRLFTYDVTGNITSVQFGTWAWLISGSSSNGLTSGKLIYQTASETV